MPKKAGGNLDAVNAQPQSEEDVEFERNFERDFPFVDSADFKKRKRAIGAVRREFKWNRYDDLNIYVVVNNDENREVSVSAEAALEREDTENNVRIFTNKRHLLNAYGKRGHEVKKANLEKRTENESADIIIMLDEKTAVTPRLLRNVELGGWILCRMNAANAVRATGNYKLMGVVDYGRATPSVDRDVEEYWAKSEIEDDRDFESAKDEEAVSYQEALAKVEKARLPTDNVLKSYQKLVELAREQNNNSSLTPLSCSITHGDETIDLGEINTVLPLKDEVQNSENIVVFKKHEFV